MLPLVAIIVFLGVYPKPVLSRIEPSVNAVIGHVQDATGYHQPAVAAGSGVAP
jgi:NADH-quinone oxidoreductase subunit M